MNYKKKNTIIVISVAVVFLLITMIISAIVLKIMFGDTGITLGATYSNNLIYTETFYDSYENMYINNEAGDVEILKSSDDDLKVVIYGNEELFKVSDKNGTLTIDGKAETCSFLCFNKKLSIITVYVPEDLMTMISIDNSFGNIKVNNVNNLKIDNKFGNININAVNNYIDINSDMGDINIENLYLFEDSYIKSDVGNINIGMTNDFYIDATSNVGEVNIKNNNRKSEVTLKLESDVGDITIKN